MTVRVLFLGGLSDRFGRERTVAAPAAGLSLEDLKAAVAGDDPDGLAALGPPVRVAVDQEVAPAGAAVRVRPGQEVAFFPIFSGG